MVDKFSLTDIGKGLNSRTEDLASSENTRTRSYDEPRPSDTDGPFKPFTFQQSDFDRTEPDKDEMHKYWRQFETTPFVRKSITSFARQVMEPGYYIQAEDVDIETLRDIDHWLSNAAIVEGEFDQDFRKLAKKAIIQQEVRGTSFIEKAPKSDNLDEIAALKLINAETMESVTRPGQSILLQPEDIDEYESAPAAESGGAAAWLQDLGETETFFGTPVSGVNRGIDNDKDDDFKVGFREDEIIKLARDADAGEIFGTSRLEAVSDRIEGLRQKLSDNDDAIASKAYPLWLFLFGSEDNPWEGDDIDTFMRSHEMENFHSGMKQGVRGDVDIKTISGEVADIADSLDMDINWIMSVMPIPKYALGAFADSTVGQFGGIEQQQETQRQIKDERREIEEKFTPVVQQVGRQLGLSDEEAKSLKLQIGKPDEPDPEVPRRENVIRYIPKDERNPQTSKDSRAQDDVPQGMKESNPLPSDVQDPNAPQEGEASAGAHLWHTNDGISSLSLSDDNELADIIYESFRSVRDGSLERVEDEYTDAPIFASTKFESLANGVINETLSRTAFRNRIKPIVEERVLSAKGDALARTNTNFFVQNIETAVENAVEEMVRLMRLQVRRGTSNSTDWGQIENRVVNKYTDGYLRERAELIAHMESKNIEETLKLQRYEQDDDVVGVRIVNDDPQTPLTKSLAGEVVYFDDGDIQEQLQEKTRSEFVQNGFDPLPATPPFHFNDTSSLRPVYRDA